MLKYFLFFLDNVNIIYFPIMSGMTTLGIGVERHLKKVFAQISSAPIHSLLLLLVSPDVDPVLFFLDLHMKYTVEVFPLCMYIASFVIV